MGYRFFPSHWEAPLGLGWALSSYKGNFPSVGLGVAPDKNTSNNYPTDSHRLDQCEFLLPLFSIVHYSFRRQVKILEGRCFYVSDFGSSFVVPRVVIDTSRAAVPSLP